jgi:hypothetical protein
MAMTITSHDAIQMNRNHKSLAGFELIFVLTLPHKVGDPGEIWGCWGFTFIRGVFPPGRLVLGEGGYGDCKTA